MKNLCRIVLLLAAVSLAACKTEVKTSVPSTRVSLEFNILRDAPTLNAIGGVASFVKPKYIGQYLGYGGVVVFHNFDDRFVAFDLACPNEVDPQVRLNVDSIPGEAVCPQCGAVFDIGYGHGYPVAGDCRNPMRQYGVAISNYDVHVYN